MNILHEKRKARGFHCQCADTPDTSGQQQAALQMSALSAEQLAWAKTLYAETAPDRADATRRANLVSDAQLESMSTQTALAKDYAAYQQGTFRPLEQGIVADARGYDTPDRREAEAGKAIGDVSQQFSAGRDEQNRNMARYGINPADGKFAATNNQMMMQEALAKSFAGNKARTQVETVGQARKMDAANLGRNLPSNQATSAGLALTAGNNAAANGTLSGNIAAQGGQIMTGGYAGAQSGLAGAAGTYGAINRAKPDDSGMWGALGTLGGAAISNAPALMALSDVNMKENITPTDPDAALEAVEKTPVSDWAYKPSSPADDGGQKHTGPMAQDVKKTMGAKTAPGGKKIDLIAMSGITMAALQSLSKKVDRIAAAAGIPA